MPSATAAGVPPTIVDAEEWCRTQLNNLRINDRRLESLAELRHHLTEQPAASWTHALSVPDIFIGVANVVCQLPGSEPTATANACDILSLCMSTLTIGGGDDAAGGHRYVLECLLHASIDVRLLGLHEIQRLLAAGAQPPLDPDTIRALIACLLDDSERVGQPAIGLLVRLVPVWLAAGAVVFDVDTLLQATAGRSDVLKCRVHELAVAVAAQSPDSLMAVDRLLTGGLLNDLKVASSSDAGGDVLLHLNLLQLTADLAQTAHGLAYLDAHGICELITSRATALEHNPLRGILVPAYMRFFGAIAAGQPERVLDGAPAMVQSLFACLETDDWDVAVLPTALDTLGHLARSDAGVRLLHARYAERLRATLRQLRLGVNNLPTAMQVRVLNCLEEMMRVDEQPGGGVSNQVTSITQTWFGWLNDTDGADTAYQQLTFLHDYCRKPFPDIKLAAVTLCTAVCTHPWGQQAMARTAGFVEFLLDRHADFDKDVKQEKFTLVRRLAAATAATAFDEHIAAQLREYVQQGAFYVPGVMEVAVDGGA